MTDKPSVVPTTQKGETMKKEKPRFISEKNVVNLIRRIKNGQFFSVFFIRAQPVCLRCGRKNEHWARDPNRREKYCDCGGEISYVREALAQKGVSNPQDETIRPKGVGLSFAERLDRGNFGFYDSQLKQYRQCRVSNLVTIKTNGIEYIVVH